MRYHFLQDSTECLYLMVQKHIKLNRIKTQSTNHIVNMNPINSGISNFENIEAAVNINDVV